MGFTAESMPYLSFNKILYTIKVNIGTIMERLASQVLVKLSSEIINEKYVRLKSFCFSYLEA